ncbi:MAG: excinuclease ABC subunit UvrA [Acidobacteria bacterium]|nr:excinuclease ABC subunit UvrA [Acidobacteriota bacterium]
MATAVEHKLPQGHPASTEAVRVRGCRVHNLKNIDFEIPHNKLTVVTGVSGSGKSSLAFDTLYAEGQRRYVESMSAYARQFLERMEKPDADEILGIAPTIAIKQKNTTRNPRSTVGTTTEIYDYLRLLFARIGQTFCQSCGAQVKKESVDEVAEKLLALAEQSARPGGPRAYILFPMFRATVSGEPKEPNQQQLLRGVYPEPSRGAQNDSAEGREIGKRKPNSGEKESVEAERLKARLFELRKLGFNRLYQPPAVIPSGARDLLLEPKLVEFSTPESLLDLDFRKPVWILADRLAIAPEARQRLIDSLEICYREGGEAVVEFPDTAADASPQECSLPERLTFNERFECKRCRIAYAEPEPRLFSFNSPYGACPRCHGFGNTIDFDPDLVISDPTLALDDGAVNPWTKPRYRHFYHEFKKVAREQGVRLDVPYSKLSEKEKEFVWDGRAAGKRGRRAWVGIKGFFAYLDRKKYKLHVRVFLSRYRGYALCPECQGGRLRQEAYWVRIGGEDLRAVCRMSIEQVRKFFDEVQLNAFQEVIAGKILQEVRQRLKYLENVGLEYLTLDRLTATLSGGEAQRIQLAASLGSQLVGALYVLDEPSIGLHSRDTGRLIRILEELRYQGNTILVVEHDPAMMEAADRILDLGPGAGENGGRVQFAGSYPELLSHSGDLTASYLRGDFRIQLPPERRKPTKKELKIHGAFAHNLKSIDVAIPLGMMVAVTGVSGSGKSSLVYDVLYEALRGRGAEPAPPLDLKPSEEAADEPQLGSPSGSKLRCRRIEGTEHIRKVVLVDQSPIGRTPRSNPVTYVKAFDPIRTLFAEQPAARKRGYTPGYFSFNIPGGRCETCQGNGTVTVEMQFLADVELVCEECKGTRFKSSVLEVAYRGRNIHEVLGLTVREALTFFNGVSPIVNRLRILDEVGLGYLRLGQSATTLSGGEAQRIKLGAHLAARESEGTLYLFDEPTTGLHFDDINKLLAAFRKLVESGGSIVVVEHHLDVIKTADWVIDLGPEGGDQGGALVAAGTPEKIARFTKSYTGKFLRPVLERHRQWGEEV